MKLKLIIILTIIMFFEVGIDIFAQEKFKPKTIIGINQGINISFVNFSPFISQNPKVGYSGGLVFIHVSEPRLGVQIEINYAQRGWDEFLISPKKYSRSLNYIELPFLTYFELGRKKFKFLLNLGPVISYLVSNTENIYLIEETQFKSHYQKSINNKFDFGLAAGGGFSLNTSIGVFQIEGRFTQALTSIFKESNNELFSGSQNQIIGIKLSYLYNYKKIIPYRNNKI